MGANILVDFRSKTAEELAAETANMRRQYFGLRMQKATQQLANSSELPRARRNIARALTVLRERELGIARSAQAPASLLLHPPRLLRPPHPRPPRPKRLPPPQNRTPKNNDLRFRIRPRASQNTPPFARRRGFECRRQDD